MGILSKLFGQKKKASKTTSQSTGENTFSRAKNIKDRASSLYNISVESEQLHKAGKIRDQELLLEKSIYEMDSDIPSHYRDLADLYEKENNTEALKKLHDRTIKEANKKRNQPNGSNVKFKKIAESIQYTLALPDLSRKLAQLIDKDKGLNKNKVVEKIVTELDLDTSQANKLYKYALDHQYIQREKIKGVYQHSAK